MLSQIETNVVAHDTVKVASIERGCGLKCEVAYEYECMLP